MRFIDADALKRRAQRVATESWKMRLTANVETVLNQFIDWIDQADTAEPERKTGRWIPVDSFSAFGGDEATWMAHGNPIAYYYCSECKQHAYAGETGDSLLTAYCPDCGAKMIEVGEIE